MCTVRYEGELLTRESQVEGRNFFDSLDTDSVLLSCLDQLMEFYQSRYGFVYIDSGMDMTGVSISDSPGWKLVASCVIDKDRLRIVESSVSSGSISPSLLVYLNNKEFFIQILASIFPFISQKIRKAFNPSLVFH